MQPEVVAPLSKAVQRGIFIVFEGLDRSGKSTQSKMLAQYLKEEKYMNVKTIAFPSKLQIDLKQSFEKMRAILKYTKHENLSVFYF
jgi:thymidylate kinase